MNNLEHVNVDIAAEHMVDSGFEKLLYEKNIMPLAKSYLLIEMSYLQASINFDEALNKVKDFGYSPILAHPERYVYFHNKLSSLNKIKNKGVFFQLNMLSLSNYYGKDVNKIASILIKENLIDFLASDTHSINHINQLKTITVNTSLLDLLFPIITKTIYSFK
tara:strand:- start:7218 stop:7706 length:489 start_codon:yes stop_codon:yes gene_type:complete